jgi:hypothetical protein
VQGVTPGTGLRARLTDGELGLRVEKGNREMSGE